MQFSLIAMSISAPSSLSLVLGPSQLASPVHTRTGVDRPPPPTPPAAAWRCVVLQVSPDEADRHQHGYDYGEQHNNQDRRLKRIRRDV